MEIKTVNLTKVMGSNFSLQPLNLDIKGPGLIGYLGPNGAGKTTTLKLFTNLLFPSGGEIFIDGVNVHADPVSAMKNVSALIEAPEPYNYYSVKEFLNFIGLIKGLNKSDLAEQINKFTEMFHIDNPNMLLLFTGNESIYFAVFVVKSLEIAKLPINVTVQQMIKYEKPPNVAENAVLPVQMVFI